MLDSFLWKQSPKALSSISCLAHVLYFCSRVTNTDIDNGEWAAVVKVLTVLVDLGQQKTDIEYTYLRGGDLHQISL